VLPKDVPEMQAQTEIYSKDRPLMRARTKRIRYAVKSPMVDPSKSRIGYCFRGGGVELGSTGARWWRMSRSRLVPATTRRDGEERQGHVPDPARRRGRGLPAAGGRQGVQELRGRKVPFQLEVTAAPATASLPKKTRPRSNAKASRSPQRRETLKELFGS